jgi:hypothetical protein
LLPKTNASFWLNISFYYLMVAAEIAGQILSPDSWVTVKCIDFFEVFDWPKPCVTPNSLRKRNGMGRLIWIIHFMSACHGK